MKAIITYHSIDGSGSPISCDPSAFDRHLRFFSSGRVTVTTIPELFALPVDADAVAIAFDDALDSFGAVAAPRLADLGLPCTVFVVTGHAGGTNAWRGAADPGIPAERVLDWPALVALRADGVEIGSHSRTHPDLTALGPAALEDEIARSADDIERETGVRPRCFAYPYGRVTPDVARLTGRAYAYACTTRLAGVTKADPPALLPRLDAYYFQKAGRLEAWGTPAFDRYLRLRAGLRRLRGA
jgi:peptidoglycan/xylan/chitin deacetylase (PgdA/CDA1 family)